MPIGSTDAFRDMRRNCSWGATDRGTRQALLWAFLLQLEFSSVSPGPGSVAPAHRGTRRFGYRASSGCHLARHQRWLERNEPLAPGGRACLRGFDRRSGSARPRRGARLHGHQLRRLCPCRGGGRLDERGEPERAWGALHSAAWWGARNVGEAPPAMLDGARLLCPPARLGRRRVGRRAGRGGCIVRAAGITNAGEIWRTEDRRRWFLIPVVEPHRRRSPDPLDHGRSAAGVDPDLGGRYERGGRPGLGEGGVRRHAPRDEEAHRRHARRHARGSTRQGARRSRTMARSPRAVPALVALSRICRRSSSTACPASRPVSKRPAASSPRSSSGSSPPALISTIASRNSPIDSPRCAGTSRRAESRKTARRPARAGAITEAAPRRRRRRPRARTTPQPRR